MTSSRNEHEVAKLGYTAGINVCFRKKNIEFETGLHYSNKGYKTKMTNQVYFPPDGSLLTQGQLIYNSGYLDIPAKATVTFGETRFRFCAGAGFVVNILCNQSITVVGSSGDGDKKRETTGSHFDYKKLNFSPTISAGLNYQVNNNSSVRVEPTFRYGVLKLKDAPVSEYLWNAGLAIGYYIQLK